MVSQFNELLLQHLPRLQGYAIMLTRNRSIAEDLLQETAFRALGAQRQFAMGTNFTAWIYRILRNEYINMLRRAKRQPLALEDAPPECLVRSEKQEADLLRSEIFTAMNQLPADQREALVLTCAGGLSYQEIADAMECAVGTVKSRLWRARARMATLLLGDEGSTVIANAVSTQSKSSALCTALAPGNAAPELAVSSDRGRRASRAAIRHWPLQPRVRDLDRQPW